MNNRIAKKLVFSLVSLIIILSAYLVVGSVANSVPAEFYSSGYHLYEYDIRSRIFNGEERYNITVNDLRREYAILCCQHGTALPSGDPIPAPAISAGLDGENITEPMNNIAEVTNSTKDFYSEYDGIRTRTAAWYKVTQTKDATPEEAYILAEMVLDTQVIDVDLIYYEDENGNRQEVSEGEMNGSFAYEYGGQRYFLYNMKFAVLTDDGQYEVEYGGVDPVTGKTYYTYKVKAGGTDYVKYNGDLTITDPKFQIESGASYIDLDSFEYSFEGTINEPENLVTDGKVYITSDEAAKYDEETGRYYRAYASGGEFYVQHAWWASDANIGTKTVPNGLSKEAKAFEQYILRVTRSNSVSEVMKKYTPHDFEIELNGTVYTGTVPAAPIEYNARYMERDEVANILNVDPETLNQDNDYGISVVFDENKQAWRIGPIVMDYVEERVEIEGREPVEFAGIVDIQLSTNLGVVEKDKWRFVWLNDYRSEDDQYGYPHEQEPFYIELDYMEGAIEITDLHTTFRYMNAGGKYERLEGVYNKIYWESDYKTNRCSGPGADPNPDDEEVPKCEHGYTSSHIVSYTSWINITKVEPTDSQLLASGLIGARWYDPYEIHLGVDWEEEGPDEFKDRIPVKKEVLGTTTTNEEFEMEIYINGEYKESVFVKPNETKYSDYYKWNEGESAPTYEVKEKLESMPDGWEFVEMRDATGTLSADSEIPTAVAVNKKEDIKPDEGRLKIIKIAEGEDLQNKKYYFKIRIGNDVFDNVEISQATNWEWISELYTWNQGEKAPDFEVSEYPGEGFVLKSLNPGKGSLADKNEENLVIVTAVNTSGGGDPEHGKLTVTKKINGNVETNDTFKVNADITFYDKNGEVTRTERISKDVPGNSTVTIGEFTWEKGEKEPTYVVTEDIESMADEWHFVGIENDKGSLKADETVNVVVINEGEGYSGRVEVTKHCEVDQKVQSDAIDSTFDIYVTVTGTFEVDGESIVNGSKEFKFTLKADETGTTPEIKWVGSEAPEYTVREDVPEGWTLEEITKKSGRLKADDTIHSHVYNYMGSRLVIDLTMEMGGIVWEDLTEDTKLVEDAVHTGEGQYADGIYDSSKEFGIANVEVFVEKVLYNESDNEIGRTYASVYEEDGTPINMPIYTSAADLGRWKAPRVEVGVTDAEKAQGASYARMNVRFRYDGQTFEPTKVLATGSAEDYRFANTNNRDRWKNNSMADDIDRQEVNNRVADVYGGNSASGNSTKGYTVGTDGTTYEINYLTTAGNDDMMAKSEVITLDSNGVALDVFKANATTEKAGLVYPFDERYHLLNVDKYIDELGFVEVYHYTATEEYTKNINLGLVKRATSDLAVAKDLTKATVVANEKMMTYRYNSILGDLSQGAAVAIESKNTVNGYEVNVYDTDYYYRAAIYDGTEAGEALDAFYASIGKTAEDSELEVYLTYRILVLNNSQGNYVAEIKEIADYADKSLILVSAEETAYVQTEVDGELVDGVVAVAKAPTYTLSNGNTGNVVWTETTENIPSPDANNKAYKTNSLTGIKLARGEYAMLDVTFKVDKATNEEGVENAVILGDKYNTAEIARYSIFGTDGQIEGKIDLNSAPANINFDETYYEDDTDRAPVVKLGLYEVQREIDGIVFEDSQSETLGSEGYDQVIGDGIYEEDDDQAIGGIETTLVEKVVVPTDASLTNYVEYSVVWPTESTEIAGLGGNKISELTESEEGAGDGFSSIIKTNNDGTYGFNAVPAGTFTVEYKYGTGNETIAPIDNETIAVYNGQDFKTTAYQATENTDYLAEDGILNNEWHDFSIGKSEDGENDIRYNDARDLETRRLEVISKTRTIANTNGEVLATANAEVPEYLGSKVEEYRNILFNEYFMIAETAKLNLEIEDITSDMVQRVLNGEEIKLDGIEMNGKVIKDNPTEEENDLYNKAIVYTYKNIDCGIETRSANGISLDKQISNIKLTLSDGTTLVDTNFNIEYEPDKQDDGTYRFKAKVKKDSNGIGANQLQAVNKVEKKYEDTPSGYQNFRYLNVDEVIMQGAVISIEYQIASLNVGEVDRIGELENLETIDEINTVIEKIAYDSTHYAKDQRYNEVGRYLGSVYYNGVNAKGNDGVVKTKVNQVIDYVDNDAVFSILDNSKVDQSWKQVTEKELLGDGTEEGTYPNRIISEHLLVKDGTTLTLKDEDGKVYNTYNSEGKIQKGNIVVSVENEQDGNTYTNKGFMAETTPMGYDEEGSVYMTKMKLVTSRTIASESDADDMSFDNLAEVLRFENEVGRRDILAIPGNADPSVGPFATSLSERDQSATEVVTLTPPTGADYLNIMTFQVLLVVLAGLVIVAIGIVVIKKKVLTK